MKNEIIIENKKEIKKNRCAVILSATAALLSVIVCLCAGSSGLGLPALLRLISGSATETERLIFASIRAPRVIAAVTAGAGLSLSGCIMQKVLGNPMASPSTLGVSNGAVFGANLAIIFFGAGTVSGSVNGTVTLSNPYTVTVCAFVSAFAGISVILLLALKKRFSSETVVLCGVATGAFFSAGTTLLQYFSVDTQVSSAVFWSFGDLGRASFRECAFMLAALVAGLAFSCVCSRDLDILSAGDETARGLGINVTVLRFLSLLIASLICAVCVSFLGIIGFVGLIAPHAAKRIVGEKMSVLFPVSVFGGIVLLSLSDAIARSAIHGISLPVGAVTSLFGGPAFLYLLLRERRGAQNEA